MRRRRLGIGLVALFVAAAAAPASAYLHFIVELGGRSVTIDWERVPVSYFVGNSGVPGVDANALRATVERAFGTWQAVESSTIDFRFAGFTDALPFDEDNMSTLGFVDEPSLDRVLGATGFLIDTTTGDILEADIFFNAAFPWSIAAEGEPGRFDLESVAVHEIGHLLGLAHSAIGETELRPEGGRRVLAAGTIMFPIAFPAGNVDGRRLWPDDVAGVSTLYPEPGFEEETGAISGRVTRDGRAVLGAHVVAFNLRTGDLVSGFTLSADGSFVIAGLSPGPHLLRVEPLDDADLESFFEEGALIDSDFRVTFLDRVVVVGRRQTSRGITIEVPPK